MVGFWEFYHGLMAKDWKSNSIVSGQIFNSPMGHTSRAPRVKSHTVIPLLPRSHGSGWRRRLLPDEGIADMFGAHDFVARVWDVCLKHRKFQLGRQKRIMNIIYIILLQYHSNSIVQLTAAETKAGWPKKRELASRVPWQCPRVIFLHWTVS